MASNSVLTLTQPIDCPPSQVIKDWIDYNGHMNMAFYNVVFDKGVDHLFDLLGIGASYADTTNASCFTLETHVTYAQEVVLGDPLQVTIQLLDFDAKRLHIFLQMFHADQGYLAATMEQMVLHVDLDQRKAAALPLEAQAKLGQLHSAHRTLPVPPAVGRIIKIRR